MPIHFLKPFTVMLAFAGSLFSRPAEAQNSNQAITVRKSDDFSLTGDGSAENWKRTAWIDIPNRTNHSADYVTRVKMLYSPTGIYVLFSCADKLLTCTMNADLMDLWNEDVVEVFLWPDEKRPAYFEYELSPLNFELPICIFNEDRKFLNSWIPFHFDGDRKTRHATAVQGGEKKAHASVSGWTAECFIPFRLMQLLGPAPQSGSRWRGNLYRIDYDKGETLFSWQATSGDFHEYNKFGTLIFE